MGKQTIEVLQEMYGVANFREQRRGSVWQRAEWVANLYGDHAMELGDVGLFLSALQERFKDNTRVQQAEGDMLKVKQRGRPVSEYIREFRWLVGKVWGDLSSWWCTDSRSGLTGHCNKPVRVGAWPPGWWHGCNP